MITAKQAKELLDAATSGPWRWRNTQGVFLWGNSQAVMAFARSGMNGAQPVMLRHRDGVYEKTAKANLNEFPDARLIAAAPDLAQTVIDLSAQIADGLAPHYRDGDFCHECFDQPWPCRTFERLGGPSDVLDSLEIAEAQLSAARSALSRMDVAGVATALGEHQ
jgi:hypothetical protein